MGLKQVAGPHWMVFACCHHVWSMVITVIYPQHCWCFITGHVAQLCTSSCSKDSSSLQELSLLADAAAYPCYVLRSPVLVRTVCLGSSMSSFCASQNPLKLFSMHARVRLLLNFNHAQVWLSQTESRHTQKVGAPHCISC